MLVNLATAVRGCALCTKQSQLVSINRALVRLAAELGVPSITVNASKGSDDSRLFSAADRHLSPEGHQVVGRRVLGALLGGLDPPRPTPALLRPMGGAADDGDLRTACQLGEELQPLIGSAVGFERVDLGGTTAAAKVGWEARQPGASLTLCIRHPLAAAGKAGSRSYRVALGLQASHALNLPLFGVATVECLGGCACNVTRMDTLGKRRVTVTNFLRLAVSTRPSAARTDDAAAPCSQCAVRITNSRNASDRTRVVVRALIAGPFGPETNFVNPFYLGGLFGSSLRNVG